MSKIWVFTASFLFTCATCTYGNPLGGSIESGNIHIQSSDNGAVTNIVQKSTNGIINWKSFDINKNQKTSFFQPSGGVTLNRVTSPQSPALIYGILSANGKIILIDPAGVFFGPGSRIDVAGIIASTTDITKNNFLKGNLIFDQNPSSNAAIVNQGTIIAKQHGLVALIGSGVSNEGTITANFGKVILASGSKFTMSFTGNPLINFTISQGTDGAPVDAHGRKLKNAVNNSGTILADGGKIIMSANAASSVLDNVINMSGVAQAQSVKEHNGVIILSGGPSGNVDVSGSINASGSRGHSGGRIKVLGNNIHIASSADINASGDTGGGNISIGGDEHGAGKDPNASTTLVDTGANISANAENGIGNGGNIVVWSNNNTQFHGTASAQGGTLGGNGGLIETSGGYLNIDGSTVSTAAPKGNMGTWLLDPVDVNIVNSSDANSFFLNNNTYQPVNGALATSTINVNNLITALASNNVLVTTSAFSGTGGTGNGDISVNAPITWSSNSNLILDAYRNIILNSNISNPTSATATATLRAGDNNDAPGVGGTVCGAGGSTNCGVPTPTGIVTMGSNQVNVYYNPQVFGTNDTIYTGGTAPTEFMLINSLGNQGDLTTPTLASLSNATLATSTVNLSDNYALSNNIDASLTSTWTGSTSGTGLTPIGNKTTNFTGSFDGQNYTINNLFMDVTNNIGSNIGLFGDVGGSAAISNLGVTNANITGASAQGGLGQINVGILAGRVNSGTLTNDYTTGKVSTVLSSSQTGGLVGFNGGTIQDSYSRALVDVTYPLDGSFSNIGGLVGDGFAGNIKQSYASGLISVNLSGSNTDAVSVGGLIGVNAIPIADSYSTSTVNVNANDSSLQVGGFVGQNMTPGTINNAYSSGAVNSSPGAVNGFVGSNAATITNSFWDTDLSQQSTGGAASGLTGGCFDGGCFNGGTANLSALATYTSSGWNIGAPNTATTWQIVDGMTYPHLANEGLFQITGIPGMGEIDIAVNGALIAAPSGTGSYDAIFTTHSGNTGIDGNIPLGSNVFIGADGGGLVFQSNGQSASSNLTANTLTAGLTGGNAVSNSILANAATPGYTDSLYNASGNDITLQSGVSLLANSKYVVDGNISTSSGNIQFTNPIYVAALNPTLAVAGGNILFNGDINGLNNSLTLNGSDFQNNNISFLDNLNITNLNNLTISDGILANNTLTLETSSPQTTWNIDTNGSGTITGISGIAGTFSFSNMQNFVGSFGANNFKIITPSISASITGNGTQNTLTGPGDDSFVISGANSGQLDNTINFSGIQNLIAPAGNNMFLFADNVNFNGNITGAATGTQTLDYSAYTTGSINADVTAFQTGTVGDSFDGNVTNFSDINTINSGNGNDIYTLHGANYLTSIDGGGGTNTLQLTTATPQVITILSPNSGVITGGLAFAHIQDFVGGSGGDTYTIHSSIDSITGGNGNDQFKLGSGGSVNTLEGGGGTNTLSYAGFSGPVAIDLQTNSATQIGSFAHIQNLVGNDGISGANTTLTGPNTTNVWNIASTNAGNLGGYTFSGVGNLSGGSGDDDFIVSDGAQIVGHVTGGTGVNTIDVSAFSSPVTLNLQTSNISEAFGGGVGTYSGISNFIGPDSPSGTNGAVIGPNGTNIWTINGTNTVSVGGNNIAGFGNYSSGTGTNDYVFDNGQSISGNLTGSGNDTLDLSAYTSPINVNLQTGSATAIGGSFSGLNTFLGSATAPTTSTLQDMSGGNIWNITATNAGTVAGDTFNQFGHLVGGNNDDFKLADGAGVSGVLTATGGTLDYSSYTTPLTIDIQNNTATNTGGIAGFTTFMGSATNPTASTFQDTAGGHLWNITATNAGTVAGDTFNQFGHLVGGNNDDFKLADGAGVSGVLAATGGTLDYSSYTTPLTIDIQNNTATNTGGIAGFTTFMGSATNPTASTFQDTAGGHLWNITATNAGMVAGDTFNQFGHLVGGNNDDFKLADGAGVSGILTATGGTLDYSSYTTPLTIDIQNNTATNTGGIAGFTTFMGSATNPTASTFQDTAGGHLWNITATNAGTVAGDTFNQFGHLVGGNNDDFKLADGAGVSGVLAATGGTLDYSSYTTPLTIDIQNNTATNTGGIAGFTTFMGSATNPTASTLQDMAGGHLWNITATNAGTVAGDTFNQFGHLVGGNNDDFKLADGAGVSGVLAATGGTLDYSSYTTPLTIDIQNNTATNTGGIAGFTTFMGSATNPTASTLQDMAGGHLWNITATNAGTVAGDTFNQFGHLVGGNNDDFKLADGAGVSGVLAATGGTLDYSSYTTPLTIDIQNNTATNTGGIAGFTTFMGSATNPTASTFQDTAGGHLWNITATNAGMVAGDTFNQFGHLVGGNNDDFKLADGAGVSGILTATGGTLDYSSYTTPLTIDIQNNTATNTGGIAGFTTFMGSATNPTASTLQDMAGGHLWNITATNAGTVASDTFNQFGHLVGGNNDDFKLADGAGVSGVLAATGGTLDYSSYTTPNAVDLQNNTATNVGGFTGFTHFLGSDSAFGNTNSTLIGPSLPTVWGVTATNAGNLNNNAITFNGFGNLVGGNSSGDTFVIDAPISTITGGTGANTYTINPGADVTTLNGGGSVANSNTFFINGGLVTSLIGGIGPDNFLSTNTSNAITFDSSSSDSGSISGPSGVTIVGSFTEIPNFTTSENGDTLNISSSFGSINTGPNTTVNVLGPATVNILNGSSDNKFNISGDVGTLNGGSGTNIYTLNSGAIVSLLHGGSGSNNKLIINSTASNIWDVSGASGSIHGGVTANYDEISNITGGNQGDTFNISGVVNKVTGGSSANQFNLANNAIIDNLFGGSPNSVNVLNLSAYNQNVDVTLTQKVNGGWQGNAFTGKNKLITNFVNIGKAVAKDGNNGILTVPNNIASTIQLTGPGTGVIPDPFVFTNFNVDQVATTPSQSVLDYATLIQVNPIPVLQLSIFNYVNTSISEMLDTESQLDLEIRDMQQFGCF